MAHSTRFESTIGGSPTRSTSYASTTNRGAHSVNGGTASTFPRSVTHTPYEEVGAASVLQISVTSQDEAPDEAVRISGSPTGKSPPARHPSFAAARNRATSVGCDRQPFVPLTHYQASSV